MESHPHPVPVDAVITVIADGWRPTDVGASEQNARQPTFWHRAHTVRVAHEQVTTSLNPENQRGKELLN